MKKPIKQKLVLGREVVKRLVKPLDVDHLAPVQGGRFGCTDCDSGCGGHPTTVWTAWC